MPEAAPTTPAAAPVPPTPAVGSSDTRNMFQKGLPRLWVSKYLPPNLSDSRTKKIIAETAFNLALAGIPILWNTSAYAINGTVNATRMAFGKTLGKIPKLFKSNLVNTPANSTAPAGTDGNTGTGTGKKKTRLEKLQEKQNKIDEKNALKKAKAEFKEKNPSIIRRLAGAISSRVKNTVGTVLSINSDKHGEYKGFIPRTISRVKAVTIASAHSIMTLPHALRAGVDAIIGNVIWGARVSTFGLLTWLSDSVLNLNSFPNWSGVVYISKLTNYINNAIKKTQNNFLTTAIQSKAIAKQIIAGDIGGSFGLIKGQIADTALTTLRLAKAPIVSDESFKNTEKNHIDTVTKIVRSNILHKIWTTLFGSVPYLQPIKLPKAKELKDARAAF